MASTRSFMIGGACGLMAGLPFWGFVNLESGNRLALYEQDNQPRIVRTKEELKRDFIYVETGRSSVIDDSTSGSVTAFIPLESYLIKNFENHYDRESEESRIKKLIDW